MKQDKPSMPSRVPSLTESFVAVASRLALYTGVLLATYALLPEIVRNGDFAVFKEAGPIEWLQFLMLAATACMFLAGGLMFRALRQWFVVLAVLSLTACIRELDSVFDALLPYVGWQLPAVVMICVGVVTVWRNPRRFVRQAEEAVSRRGFAILWAGFVVAIVFAQLVGHGPFLKELMGDDYVRDYKRVIEELGELFGYALLVMGSVESLLEVSSSRRTLARQATSRDGETYSRATV